MITLLTMGCRQPNNPNNRQTWPHMERRQGFQVELFYSRNVSFPRKACLYGFRTANGNHTHATAIQDAISPTIWACFSLQGIEQAWQNTYGRIFRTVCCWEPPRRLRIPRRRTAVAVEDMSDSVKKETFCAVAVSFYFGERYFRSK